MHASNSNWFLKQGQYLVQPVLNQLALTGIFETVIGHPRSGPAGLGGGPSSGSYHPSSTWLFVRYMGRNKSKPNRGAVSRARSSLPACFRRRSPGPLRLARLSSATSLAPPKGFWVGDGEQLQRRSAKRRSAKRLSAKRQKLSGDQSCRAKCMCESHAHALYTRVGYSCCYAS